MRAPHAAAGPWQRRSCDLQPCCLIRYAPACRVVKQALYGQLRTELACCGASAHGSALFPGQLVQRSCLAPADQSTDVPLRAHCVPQRPWQLGFYKDSQATIASWPSAACCAAAASARWVCGWPSAHCRRSPAVASWPSSYVRATAASARSVPSWPSSCVRDCRMQAARAPAGRGRRAPAVRGG